MLLLAPGLAAKASWTYHEVAADYRGAAQSIARQFAARGWSAEAVEDNLFPYARLANGDCRMVAAAMMPSGAFDRRFAMQMGDYGPVTYFYRDRFEPTPPRAVPVLSYYLQRKLRALGIVWNVPPIVAIAAGPGCHLLSSDWRAFRSGTTIVAPNAGSTR